MCLLPQPSGPVSLHPVTGSTTSVPRERGGSTDPQIVILFRNRGFADPQVQKRSFGWALTQHDWCSYKKGKLEHTHPPTGTTSFEDEDTDHGDQPNKEVQSVRRSVMSDSATPWTVACVSCVHGLVQLRILEWVAILFSRGSSQPSDGTQVSCIAGGFFTV